MNRVLILGAGTAGTMAANHLRGALDESWSITVVDRDDEHHYQPGYLFIPFWMKPERVKKSRRSMLHAGIEFVEAGVSLIHRERREVELIGGRLLAYDWLIIASGTRPDPSLVEGMADGALWRDRVHEFYTLEGSVALKKALADFTGGRILVHISEMPIKCPVAPLEFAFLVEDHFRKKGIRHKVDITYVTPLDGAFTKPVASKELGGLLRDRSIRLAADFAVERIDNDSQRLVSYDGRELPFDLLVTVPPNVGQQFIMDSGLGNDAGFVPVDKHTLRALDDDRIFVLGDASDIPTSKAGSVAHFATEEFIDNFLAAIEDRPLPNAFDGHANCFVESGRGQALLLDFNYETEPLLGTFPVPYAGPLRLLKPTRLNHLGKLAFEQIYWQMLLPGRPIPISSHMTMAGKHKPKE
ncbi:NAD(P)/FAD-dependent oxidoreductase [Flaviflexus salsibiostraticola]|uniref:NAD(P)/FAD-dependent oxidoreductase n=1 Tax=Flaviflexus salsibiostraticola TaxID=1282737 RepID=A0A3Q8WWK5_9ACTO|nr:FAD/NAD(P)-binding oxidoreductase [Flaviflexus salsibiostraticola]AZN30703.1 NAD(P)/FAD-dependent oxidoreductase [Flaviflexus salsibiostraticola]